jgi:putative ABC transport system ATP-binding protein
MIGEMVKHTGSLSFEGNDLSKMNVETMSEYRSNIISFVSQDLSLFENLSVKENLSLFDNGSFDLDQGLDQLMLRDKISKETSLLSQGEKQRLAILRALNKSHQMLVLDEPFSHLDNDLTRKAWGLIDKACSHNNAGLLLLSLEKADFGHWDSQISLS